VTHAISVIKENIQLLEYLEGAVRARYRTGKATHSDLIKVQVELDKLQDRLKSTEEMLIPVMAKLNSALNRSPRSPLPKPAGLNTNIDAVDYAQMVQWLKEHNPELKAIEHMAAGAKIKQQLARKNYYPDFSIGVDYMLTGEARMPGVPDSGKDPLAAMMTVNLPIRFKKIRASVREAGARFISVNKMREERENNLLARLEMVFYKFNDSGRKLALYKDALIPKAMQALEVTQSAFEAGKVDFLNLIDSQRTLLGFELAYERALSARHQRLAELEMIVGKEFSRQ
jgi:outer membrane protein TolC